MVEIEARAYPLKNSSTINQIQNTSYYTIEAEASCTVYYSYTCEKCGYQTGIKPTRMTIKKSSMCSTMPQHADVTAKAEELRKQLERHISELEALPETADRSPSHAYIDGVGYCPNCNAEQSWWTKKDSKMLFGCGVVGTALGLIGLLLVFVFGAEDFGGVLMVVGALGAVFLLIFLILKARVWYQEKNGAAPRATWYFTNMSTEKVD